MCNACPLNECSLNEHFMLMKRTREKDKRETTYDEKIHDNTSAISWEHQDFCVNHAEE